MGTVLGIDYGDARIGLAVTDKDRKHALAHGTVLAQPPVGALTILLTVIEREAVDTLVVGLPLTLDGTEGKQAVKTRVFAASLRAAATLPLEFIDERFTTSGGRDVARLKGTASADAEAARLILQTWLDRRSAKEIR
jgi:putative Holliday junction resolvase